MASLMAQGVATGASIQKSLEQIGSIKGVKGEKNSKEAAEPDKNKNDKTTSAIPLHIFSFFLSNIQW